MVVAIPFTGVAGSPAITFVHGFGTPGHAYVRFDALDDLRRGEHRRRLRPSDLRRGESRACGYKLAAPHHFAYLAAKVRKVGQLGRGV
jgi:hypothetical protein